MRRTWMLKWTELEWHSLYSLFFSLLFLFFFLLYTWPSTQILNLTSFYIILMTCFLFSFLSYCVCFNSCRLKWMVTIEHECDWLDDDTTHQPTVSNHKVQLTWASDIQVKRKFPSLSLSLYPPLSRVQRNNLSKCIAVSVDFLLFSSFLSTPSIFLSLPPSSHTIANLNTVNPQHTHTHKHTKKSIKWSLNDGAIPHRLAT